jgi:hypothetical protein
VVGLLATDVTIALFARRPDPAIRQVSYVGAARSDEMPKPPACDACHISKRRTRLGCIYLDADHVGVVG